MNNQQLEDSAFDFLHMEMVMRMSSADPELSLGLTVSKMEHLGYDAGYRIVERINRDFPRFKVCLLTLVVL